MSFVLCKESSGRWMPLVKDFPIMHMVPFLIPRAVRRAERAEEERGNGGGRGGGEKIETIIHYMWHPSIYFN